MDAGGTTDPDGDNLVYLWFQYTEGGSYKKSTEFVSAENLWKVTVRAPQVEKNETAHLHAQHCGSWALAPPMGWNSWDCFGSTVTEQEVQA